MSETKQARYSRKLSAFGAEIGPIPKVVDPDRRERCRLSLREFCETYRASAFGLNWSQDHLRVITMMERALAGSGMYALAMPRGSGKTTLAVTAAMWSLLYGHQQWVCLIGASESSAIGLLKSIKTELRFNSLLLEDFPEACFPIAKLEGRATRATAQVTEGHNTNIGWLANELTFPVIPGAACSGAVVSCAGITGEIRGQVRTLSDGSIRRPTAVILDDPQTRGSALSATQTKDRLETIAGDVMGLAGPGVRIAAVMPCTVICKHDLADQILTGRWPGWNVECTKMLYGSPENPKALDAYFQRRHDEIYTGGSGELSTDYYRDHQSEIESGYVAAWPERFNSETEVSAVHHALNIMFRDEKAFQAEFQNTPDEFAEAVTMTELEIASKVGHTARLIVPHECNHIVGFIDVQKHALFYTVVACADNFTSRVIDYGMFPSQGTNNIAYRNIRERFEDRWPGEGLESHLVKAFDEFVPILMDRTYVSEGGDEFSLERLLIDANWGQSTGVVYRWIRSCRWKSQILPSHGKFIGASTDALNAGASSKSAQLGDNWRIARSKNSPQRHALYDANYWKSFVQQRIETHPGVSGSLDFYSDKPSQHSNIAAHLRSEYSIRKEGRGRVVDEWKIRPGLSDNHWLDCLAGSMVAASTVGCALKGPDRARSTQTESRRSKRKGRVISASEL